MKTILTVIGTRPEAIKMCPLLLELQACQELRSLLCVTAQHRELLDSVLQRFSIVPDYDLNVMRSGQSLSEMSAKILSALDPILERVRPDLVLVHGDTTTAFSAALACFYRGIPIGHVEAGLRTRDLLHPFPEEFNRQAIGIVARYHFAPTERAKQNLLAEGVPPSQIFVTGNTALDALRLSLEQTESPRLPTLPPHQRLIFLTLHRRENQGAPLCRILRAVRRVLTEHPDLLLVCPLHPNPTVRSMVTAHLRSHPRVLLTEPLDVFSCHRLMQQSDVILTDSGGIQEEAPYLHKPVLVLRDKTERPEAVETGACRLVGTEEEGVYRTLSRLLTDPALYQSMTQADNPYGDGFAAARIVHILTQTLSP